MSVNEKIVEVFTDECAEIKIYYDYKVKRGFQLRLI